MKQFFSVCHKDMFVSTDILNCFFLFVFFSFFFFKLNSHFGKSNEISPCRKLNNFLKQYIFSSLCPRNGKKYKEDLHRPKTLQVFLLYQNLNDSQIVKNCCYKKLFLECVYYRQNLLWWKFFTSCDNWKILFFIKICH